MNIYPIGRKAIETIVKKKKMGKTVYVDEKMRSVSGKFTSTDRQLVRDHILSVPRDISHYTRTKPQREYLSSELNITRLYVAFTEKHPSSLCPTGFTMQYLKWICPTSLLRNL